MKGVIPGVNVKVFGRSVHSLSRIGEELYFEPLEHGLALRTVNSSRSAYGCFLFAPSFFLHYDDGSGHFNSADAAENLVRCKIAMKPCLGVFKSLSLLDKSVERCIVSLNMDKARLTFQLHCRHGIVKTYNLAFIECETLQAVFSKDLCPNSLLAQSRLLCDVVANFQTTQEEISFIVSPDHVCIKNYIEDEIDPSKVIRTELMVSSDEFDRYTAARDTEITFCLKELRAILAFTDSTNLPVSIHFESPGKPIIFCVDSDPTFEGNFVLATLADDITSGPSGSQQQQQQQQQRCGVSTASTSNVKNKRPAEAAKTRLETPAAGDAANLVLDRPMETVETRLETLAAGDADNLVLDRRKRNLAATTAKLDATYRELVNDTNCDVSSDVSRDCGYVTSNGDVTSVNNGTKTQPQTPACDRRFDEEEVGEEEDGEVDVLVPGTPPSKKFKSLFFGLSQSTTSGSQSQPPPPVLAEDTDDED